MVGVIAVTELIEAIGWVMEEGTYVKKVVQEPDQGDAGPEIQYCWFGNSSGINSGCFVGVEQAARHECSYLGATFKELYYRSNTYSYARCQLSGDEILSL